MKLKPILSLFICIIVLVSTLSLRVVLAGESWEKVPHLEPGTTVTTVTDPAQLSRLSCEVDPSLLEGHKLTKVIITNVVLPPSNLKDTALSASTDFTAEPYFWGPNWEIRNFYKDSYQIIYPNSPVRNSLFPGPATATMTISETATSTFTASTGVSLSVVEAKLGHSVSQSVTVSDSIAIPVPSGKVLQIKAFILYDQWRMDVYKDGNFVGTEFYHQPVGVSFKQYMFQRN